MASEKDITKLLISSRNGNEEAKNKVFSIVYKRLKLIAKGQLKRLSPGETLNATALVNELYLNLIDQTLSGIKDRVHFFKLSATAMRRIIINELRKRQAQRRGEGKRPVAFDSALHSPEEETESLLALEEALRNLESYNKRLHRIAELHFYLGMTYIEIGDLLDLNERTIRRDWLRAKAFLSDALAA